MVSVGAGVGTAVADDAAAASNEDGGDGWPMAGYSARGTGYAPNAEGPQTSLGVAWSYNASENVEGPPAVVNGTAYLADGENLTALNATTGAVAWKRSLHPADGAVGTPAVVNGTVFVTTEPGSLTAVDATTGDLVWEYTTRGDQVSPPVVADGTVYYATNLYEEQEIHAVNATDGKRRWAETAGTNEGHVRTPAVSDDYVYFSHVNARVEGEVTVYERESGDSVEKLSTPGRFITPPIVSDDVLVGTLEGLTDLSPPGPHLLNERRITGRPAVTSGPEGQTIIAPATSEGKSQLTAYDGNGTVRWQRVIDFTGLVIPNSHPATTTEAVYLNDEGTLEVYDRSNGTMLGTLPVGSGASQPSVADGRAYLTTGDGRLVAVEGSVPVIAVDGTSAAVEDREVTLDASASTAPGGTITAYEWDPDGDGTYETTGPTLNRTYAHPGEHAVGVRLTSDAGATNRTTVNVTVREHVEAAVAVNDTPVAGEAVELDAGGSTDVAGTELTYEWDLDGDGTYERDGERVTVTYDESGYHSVRLRVTNGSGLSDTDATRVYVAPRDAWSLRDLYLNGTGPDVNVPDGELVQEWSTGEALYYPRAAIVDDGTVYVADYSQPPEEFDRRSDWNHDIVAVDAGTGAVDWRTPTGSIYGPRYTVANGTVYATATNGSVGLRDRSINTSLVAIDRETGAVEWNESVGAGAAAIVPIVTDDRVYAASSRTVAAMRTDGTVVWNRSISAEPTNAHLESDRLYVTDRDGNVTALNATTGERAWNVSTGTAGWRSTVRNGTVFVVNKGSIRDVPPDGALTAVDGETGTQDWNTTIETLGEIRWDDGRVYAVSGHNVTALNATTGERVWNATLFDIYDRRVPYRNYVPVSIAADGGSVYTVNEINGTGVVVALDAATGDERWRAAPASTDGAERIVAVDDRVFVDGSGLVSLDAANGSVVGNYTYDLRRERGSLVGAGGNTVFVSMRYSVAALTGPEPARTVASDLTVPATEVDAGDEVTVAATVENQGGTATTADVPVTVDRRTVENVSVSLAPGEHRTVKRTVTLDAAGNRTVAVGGATPRTVSVAGGSGDGTGNDTSDANETDDGTGGDDSSDGGSDDTDGDTSDPADVGGGGGGQGDLSDPVTTVSVEPSDDAGEAAVEVRSAKPNETVTIDVDQADTTDGNGAAEGANDSEGPAEVTAVELVPAEGGNYDLTVNGAASPPADVPAPTANGSRPVDYVVVGHEFPDSEVESVTFTVTVSRERLDELDAAPEDVRVERYSDGNWTALPTRVERETVDGFVVSARSPGLSAFAVAVARPALDAGEPSLNRTAVAPDGGVTVSVPVGNDGGAAGTASLPVSVDGETVTTVDVTVPPGESRTATATVTFDDAGNHAVSVNGTDAGTVSVEAADATTATTTDGTATAAPETTTADGATGTDDAGTDASDAGGQPGFGPLAAAAALALWLARRR